MKTITNNNTIDAIDWNHPEDTTDVDVWNKVCENFWLPEKIAVSNDIPSWLTLTDAEKEMTKRVFVGLTMLDTMQSNDGVPSLVNDAVTDIEKSVLGNFVFMEGVHAKSYSSIFSTLCSSQEIKDIFRWARDNPILQRKANVIYDIYRYTADTRMGGLKRKVASVFLESFLFYSGFYLPLYWSSRAKLTNTADIIRLIIRDESLHGYYIGYKFQQTYDELTPDEKAEIEDFVYDMLTDLYGIESEYTEMLYDEVGLTEDVKTFIRYNANKALQNMGLDTYFPADKCQVNPVILASLSGDENHDFFSGGGSTYKIITVEPTKDEDWE